MTHPVDRDRAERQRRLDQQHARDVAAQLRADVQEVMNLPAMRRILFLFMQQTGLDVSPFATNAMQQSHAIGMQDAAKWWVNLIREHCPEKEAQVRREGLAAAKNEPTSEDETE